MKSYKFYTFLAKQALKMPYYAFAASKIIWRYKNRKYLRAYKKHAPHLSPLQRRIVNDLETHGIAFTHVDEFFGEHGVLAELQHASLELIASGTRTTAKDFLKYFLRNYGDPADLDDPLVKRMLDSAILDVISAYFSMFARLTFFSGNVAIPVKPQTAPKKSQCWHRDGGLHKLCKIFIYLNDVNDDGGPFTYVADTPPGGARSSVLAHKFFGHGSYYPSETRVNTELRTYDMEKNIKKCTGKAGTMIFCNTLGLHRGGYATTKERMMLTWEYDYTPLDTPVEIKFGKTKNLAEKIAALRPLTQHAISAE